MNDNIGLVLLGFAALLLAFTSGGKGKKRLFVRRNGRLYAVKAGGARKTSSSLVFFVLIGAAIGLFAVLSLIGAITINPVLAVLFLAFVGLLLYYYWTTDKVFIVLANEFPDYYQSIREPMYFSDASSSLRAHIYMFVILFKDTPFDFPDDQGLRQMVQRSRVLGSTTIACLAIFAMVGYMLTR